MAYSHHNLTSSPQTPVTINLIIINVIMLLASFVLASIGYDLDNWLSLHYYDASSFHAWQSFTYMFMHGGIYHLLCNMLSLYIFGRYLELSWGSQRFLIYYLVCGVGAAITQQLAWRYGIISDMLDILRESDPAATYGQVLAEYDKYIDRISCVGASGSVFGILLAFGMMYPNNVIMLIFPPIALKAKWFVLIYGVIELFAGLSPYSTDAIAHFAHLGGMLFGFLLIMFWRNKGRMNI